MVAAGSHVVLSVFLQLSALSRETVATSHTHLVLPIGGNNASSRWLAAVLVLSRAYNTPTIDRTSLRGLYAISNLDFWANMAVPYGLSDFVCA